MQATAAAGIGAADGDGKADADGNTTGDADALAVGDGEFELGEGGVEDIVGPGLTCSVGLAVPRATEFPLLHPTMSKTRAANAALEFMLKG